ncbi:MAG: STAS domain-containing protein [Pseudomonadota bacterium]
MAFKSKLSEEGDMVTVRLAGSLDALSINDFKIVLNEVMKTGKKKILFIMKDLTFINSGAIGSFLSFNKWVSGVGGMLKIGEVHPRALQVFKMMRFETVISFYDSTSEALEAFKENRP